MLFLITGASKGIGEYLLTHFREDGFPVYGTCFATPPNVNSSILTKIDIRNYEEVEKWVNQCVQGYNEITLINCAGINYNKFCHQSEPEMWKDVIDVNLIGTYNSIRSVIPIMRNLNYGRIINFSSIVAQVPTYGASAYAASKSALWGLTKSLAIENASKGITINNINLGYFDLGMTINELKEDLRNQILSKIPNGKFGNPIDIKTTIEFIINNNYLNGSSIDLNGALI